MKFERNDNKIFGSALQKLSAQYQALQCADASNCVYFSPHNLLFYVDKSSLHSLIRLVWLMCMYALYSQKSG